MGVFFLFFFFGLGVDISPVFHSHRGQKVYKHSCQYDVNIGYTTGICDSHEHNLEKIAIKFM